MTPQTTAMRRANLARANEKRMASVNVRRQIQALPLNDGLLLVADILRSPITDAGPLTVQQLLTSVTRIGDGKVKRLLLMAEGFNPTRRYTRLRDLTPRERAALVLAIQDRVIVGAPA